jgi:hypothetical protein
MKAVANICNEWNQIATEEKKLLSEIYPQGMTNKKGRLVGLPKWVKLH